MRERAGRMPVRDYNIRSITKRPLEATPGCGPTGFLALDAMGGRLTATPENTVAQRLPAVEVGHVAIGGGRNGNLGPMDDDRRVPEAGDRRAHPRGGRRTHDAKKPWYMRRRLWLATASLVYVGWRKMRGLTKGRDAKQRSRGEAA